MLDRKGIANASQNECSTQVITQLSMKDGKTLAGSVSRCRHEKKKQKWRMGFYTRG